jgi:hypothetical protein
MSRDHLDPTELESPIMQLALHFHPSAISEDYLARQLAGTDRDVCPSYRAATTAAVQKLVADGLLQRVADGLLPTRAAIRLDQLFTG